MSLGPIPAALTALVVHRVSILGELAPCGEWYETVSANEQKLCIARHHRSRVVLLPPARVCPPDARESSQDVRTVKVRRMFVRCS